MRNAISFRVSSKGVIINLNSEMKFSDIADALMKHTEEASSFFTGVDIFLNCSGRVFSLKEMQELIDIVSRYEKVDNIYFLNEQERVRSRATDTVLINRTIRSGQKLKYPTNVVIIGDINPGAEVVAGGDIIVLGKLRGVVHAGATGSTDAQIIALKLQPTQLRIGNIISRSPDETKIPESIRPERAYIKDGVIFVEEMKF
ncbi:MAG: septum site-determining protein MinC [Halanaerobiales bacterium]|nr:septum site-determining protein MinC [Halanaerobiales bacterium]